MEAICGLGVTATEYQEAKEILKMKYGGARRLLQAYMDQLEQMPFIRSNDIHDLERFSDLVRITVVKLQAEGRDAELEDGTLHSLLLKKLPECQLQNYSRWLNESAREKISCSCQKLAERRGQIPSKSGGNGERDRIETS